MTGDGRYFNQMMHTGKNHPSREWDWESKILAKFFKKMRFEIKDLRTVFMLITTTNGVRTWKIKNSLHNKAVLCSVPARIKSYSKFNRPKMRMIRSPGRVGVRNMTHGNSSDNSG